MSKTIADTDTTLTALLDEVSETQEEVVVTRDGRPVARVLPAPRKVKTLEELRNSVTFIGDIIEPVEAWDMEKW